MALGAPFWRLLTSSALSNLADGVLKVVLPLVALAYTSSPGLVAGVGIAFTLPWLLLALPAGALADRLNRRQAMVAANLLRAAAVGGLAVTVGADAGSIAVLYVVAFVAGSAETLYDTSAQSILPMVVPRERLSRANGRLLSAELTMNLFVGPPLGGVLVAVGAATALATPAGLWVLGVGALLLVRGSFKVRREVRTTLRADIAEGLRYLWGSRILRTLAVMVGTGNLASNAAFTVFVLYAVGPSSAMGLSDPGYGALLTATAAGSLVGSLLADRVESWLGRAQALGATIVTFALLVAAPALTTDVWLVGIAFAVGGIGLGVWNVVTVSLRQRVTPDALLERLNSGYRLVAWGTMPVGAALGGLVAETFGLRAVFALFGAVALCQLVGMRWVTNAAIEVAESDSAVGSRGGGAGSVGLDGRPV